MKVGIVDYRNSLFDVNKIEERLKQLGALEDIECEVIPPLMISENKNNENEQH